MAELDEIIHQPLRLRIMAALNALPVSTGLEFARLKKLTGATDGNLGAHIETLARAGYVAVDKAFVGNYNANPKLSADEKTLVMIHRQDGYTNFKVAAQDLQRGNLRILSDTSLDESPTVAPNGTMLIYATRQQGRGVLMLVSINGRVRLPLPTAQGEVREPSWSPYLN